MCICMLQDSENACTGEENHSIIEDLMEDFAKLLAKCNAYITIMGGDDNFHKWNT